MEEEFGESDTRHFTVALMLGIAYACSAGGIATLVGTPPNLSFSRIFQITFPHAPPVTFGKWIIMGFPLALALLLIIWALLTRVLYRPASGLKMDHRLVRQEYRALGPMGYEEKIVLAVFGLTAFLWVFREKIDVGVLTVPGRKCCFPSSPQWRWASGCIPCC